jgi:hypothetical protein
VVAICLTSLALFVTAILLVSLIVLAWTPNYASVWLAGAILAVAAFAFALGQLIFHLTRTFAAMRQLDESRPRSGFDPIGVLPAPPLPALPPLPAASPDSHGPTRGGAEMYQQQGDERHEQSPPTR